MSYDEVGQVIQDLFAGGQIQKKYPLTLMMPPVFYGTWTQKNGEWADCRVTLFFLTTTFYSGTNQVKNPNAGTRTSTHTIEQDWHDMKRCATNFIRVLSDLIRDRNLMYDKIRLNTTRNFEITPVTEIGGDKASGVRLDFYCSVFNGCIVEDYTSEGIAAIEIPVDDPHPEHQL